MSTVTVSGDVRVGSGATLWLGCTLTSIPGGGASPCTGKTNDVVEGSIVADHPWTMYLDGDTIWGNLISVGGGPGVTESPYVNFPIKDNVILWQRERYRLAGCLVRLHPQRLVRERGAGRHYGSGSRLHRGRDQCGSGQPYLLCQPPRPASGRSGGFPNFVGGHKTGQCSGLP